MRDAGQRHRMVPAAERLRDEARGDEIKPHAAIFRRDRDAEETLRADLGEGVLRPPFLRIHARRERVKLAARESISGPENELLIGIELERIWAIFALRGRVARCQGFLRRPAQRRRAARS